MKKTLLLLALFTLFSCSSNKVEDIASFEFNGTWYWVAQYNDGTTKQDVEDYVKKWANPNQTSYFYVYDKSIDLSIFNYESFNLDKFAKTILENKPQYGYYKIPGEEKLNTDAVWLLEQSQK